MHNTNEVTLKWGDGDMPHEDRPFLNDNDILTHLADDYETYLGAVIPPIFMNSLHVTPKAET